MESVEHNRAHVHIELGDAEYVLSISEGEVLTDSGK